jgi:hypothetical protein
LEEQGDVKVILDVRELGCEDGRKISLLQDHVQWQTDLLHINTDLVNMTFQEKISIITNI